MRPWPAGAATGVGSLPGVDIVEAVKTVFGELPGLPHLPELPARGPGAEIIGRTAGFLTDLPVELYAGRWRIAAHSGRDLRRTHDLMERDLDALTEGGAPELLQQLAHVYLGPDVVFPAMPNPPPGYVTRVSVERIRGIGPWRE